MPPNDHDHDSVKNATPSNPPPGITPDLIQQVAAYLYAKGIAIPAEPQATELEDRINQCCDQLKQAARGRAPATTAADAMAGLIKVSDQILGMEGQGNPAPSGTYQPQTDGLVDSTRQALRARQDHPARFFNVSFNADMPLVVELVDARQRLLRAYESGARRVGNHLWPDELRVYKALSSAWSYMAPVFANHPEFQTTYSDCYDYMSGRWERAAERRKTNAALMNTAKTKAGVQAQKEAENKARAEVADDLAKSFVRHLHDDDKTA